MIHSRISHVPSTRSHRSLESPFIRQLWMKSWSLANIDLPWALHLLFARLNEIYSTYDGYFLAIFFGTSNTARPQVLSRSPFCQALTIGIMHINRNDKEIQVDINFFGVIMIHRNDPSLLEPQKERNYITSSSMKFDHSLLYCDTVRSREKVTGTEKLLRCGLWTVECEFLCNDRDFRAFDVRVWWFSKARLFIEEPLSLQVVNLPVPR